MASKYVTGSFLSFTVPEIVDEAEQRGPDQSSKAGCGGDHQSPEMADEVQNQANSDATSLSAEGTKKGTCICFYPVSNGTDNLLLEENIATFNMLHNQKELAWRSLKNIHVLVKK